MTNSFENMQKLAFGKVLIKESMESKKMSKSALKAHIREMILDEAKKKKSKPEDVAPQEDVDIDLNMGDEQLPAEPAGEEIPMDTVTPEADTIGDIDPTVKSIQDSLQKAFAQAKTLGDEKLMNQIGNTITMLVRTQVLGQQNVNENMETDGTYEDIDLAVPNVYYNDFIDAASRISEFLIEHGFKAEDIYHYLHTRMLAEA